MSTLRLTTISNQGGTASVPSQTVISGTAKAWVNFDGTGTPAIRASFNVSSITDNGVGLYTVNFTTALVDTNYSISGGVSASTPASSSNAPCFAVAANSTSAFSVSTYQSQAVGNQTDLAYNHYAVFR